MLEAAKTGATKRKGSLSEDTRSLGSAPTVKLEGDRSKCDEQRNNFRPVPECLAEVLYAD